MLAIETEHLTKRYAGRSVVDDVALRVPMGCVYGFLGPNGAGKTTTMRLLLGLLRTDAGTIRLVGHDLVRRRRDALAQVGAFVESASLYDHLTGRANISTSHDVCSVCRQARSIGCWRSSRGAMRHRHGPAPIR